MAEQEVQQSHDSDNEDGKVAYKPPAVKSLDEIVNQDADDESLQKYKATLLGGDGKEKIFWPEDPRCVILKKMSILVEGRENREIDLSNESQLKDMMFNVKEGVEYRLMITFCVQREICPGLLLNNKVSRKGISVDKQSFMVGSYGPKGEEYTYTTPKDEFPSGMMARGDYKVKSVFIDDDKKELLKWEWNFAIKKEWKD